MSENHFDVRPTIILVGLSILAIIFCYEVLNPIHKNNIEKLRYDKPLAQQYTLKSSDPLWFCKPDEIGWTKGEVVYLWGYYPVIFSQELNKTFEFKEVEWTVGNE